MADKIVEVHDGGGGGALTVVAVMLMFIVLVAVLYFAGAFNRMFGPRDTKIDVNISKPSAVLFVR